MVARRGSSLDNGFVAMDHFKFIGSESCQITLGTEMFAKGGLFME